MPKVREWQKHTLKFGRSLLVGLDGGLTSSLKPTLNNWEPDGRLPIPVGSIVDVGENDAHFKGSFSFMIEETLAPQMLLLWQKKYMFKTETLWGSTRALIQKEVTRQRDFAPVLVEFGSLCIGFFLKMGNSALTKYFHSPRDRSLELGSVGTSA